MIRAATRCVALGVLLAFGLPARAAFDHYVLTDLGTLPGGSSSYAYGINSSGQVVGVSQTFVGGQYVDHAFLWSGGAMQDLGTLGGNNSCAYGINDGGQIVGSSDNGTTTHAFLYGGGTMSDLGDMCGGTGTSVAYGINNSGQVVGSASIWVQYHGAPTLSSHAFLYANGAMGDLGTLPWDDSMPGPPQSEAYAINDSGQVVGRSDTTIQHGGFVYNTSHAFLCSGAQMQDLHAIADWNTNGPSESSALSINGNGQIVGSSQDANAEFEAFLYGEGGMQDLGSFNGESQANGINAGGQIVGCVPPPGFRGDRAFLCSNGTMVDLNTLIKSTSGWILYNASAINNSGQIVGAGVNAQNLDHAYLLTPALAGDANLDGTVNGADLNTVLSNYNETGMSWEQGDFNGDGTVNGADLNAVLSNYNQHINVGAAVPEPSALVLLACGLAGLLGYVRRRK